MPLIIDGWNFIRNVKSDIDDTGGDAVESVAALVAYLADFQKRHNDPIVLVFDSSREFLELRYKNNNLLSVVPARDADEYIKKYIDKISERQRRNLRVISSDSEIYYYAKDAGAQPLKSEEFWDRLRT